MCAYFHNWPEGISQDGDEWPNFFKINNRSQPYHPFHVRFRLVGKRGGVYVETCCPHRIAHINGFFLCFLVDKPERASYVVDPHFVYATNEVDVTLIMLSSIGLMDKLVALLWNAKLMS